MVDLDALTDDDEIDEVKDMIRKHIEYTGSAHAKKILSNWDYMRSMFVKVIPKDYKRMLEAIKRMEKAGLTGEEALMAAFEENNH